MKISFAFRDERINVLAMTRGGIPSGIENLIMLYKKSIVPRIGPFILDPKKSKPTFQLSNLGQVYLNSVKEKIYVHKYIAFIDSQIRIPIRIEAFNQLCKYGYFSIWNPEAPFTTINGELYLETHHLTPLSEGGRDSIDNVCAVCPNCHRKLHYSNQRQDMTQKLLKKLKNEI